MNKKGFTLAEVIITLGIVGVIAAITLPTLMKDTTSAQIGPKLAKAVSSFEQANEALLNDNSVDSIDDLAYADTDDYAEDLANHLKINAINNYPGINDESEESLCSAGQPINVAQSNYLSKDGIIYSLSLWNIGNNFTQPHRNLAGRVFIDINGASLPNEMGTDVFAFLMYEDGSLRPYGGRNYFEGNAIATTWLVGCPENQTPSDYKCCAGHIFENNLRVLYR